MAYYCGECAVWAGSSDVDRYGRRWCSYSRRYEESNQETYGCKGFIYNGRTIITKVCEILDLPTSRLFEAFDAVKDEYVIKNNPGWLANYCKIGPIIAKGIQEEDNPRKTASQLMAQYIEPAYQLWREGNSKLSALKYKEMVISLANKYC